jgi:ABC-2 type transport system permease protein
MAIQRATRNAYTILAVVLALGVLVFANLLAEKAFRRLDLTAEKRYSLSEPFRKILSRLEDPLVLTYFVSTNVPGGFEPIKRDIIDRLEEIRMAAPERIQVDYVDPARDEKAAAELRNEGLEFQVGSVEKDKLTYSTLFTTLRVTYADKPAQLIRVVQRAEDLEYQISNKIVELTTKEKPIIAVCAPKPDQPQMPMMNRPPSSGFEWFLRGEEYSKKFDVRSVDLSESSSIPKGTKMLVLIRPKELSERARYEVARYLAEGGSVWLIASPYKVNNEMGGSSWRVEKTPTGLEDYLKDCGISFGSLLCDESNVRLITGLNPFTGEVRYGVVPFFVQIQGQAMDQQSPITRYLPSLVMPFPADIKLDEEKVKAGGLQAETLASTSPNSWAEPYNDTFDLNKVKKGMEKSDRYPNRPVFVRLAGQFPFPWEGKPAPAWEKKDEPKDEPKKDEAKKDEKGVVEKKPGVLLIWSAPESFHRMYLEQEQIAEAFQGNLSVLPNVVESSALGTDLGSLRAKRIETRSIERLEGKDALRGTIKMALIFGVSIALAIFAIARWGVRRASQIRHERSFAQTTGPSSFTP